MPSAPFKKVKTKDTRERIGKVRSRIERGIQLRKDWQNKYKLEALYKAFLGENVASGLDDSIFENHQVINRFLPTIKTILPSLFLQSPTFIVRAKSGTSDPAIMLRTKMSEALLKTIAEQEHHLEFSTKLALLQSFFSIGVLKACYDPQKKHNPQAGDIMYETLNGEYIMDEQGAPVPLRNSNGQIMREPSQIVTDEVYRWDWVNGDKMILPDAGPQFLRWPWIAEEVTVMVDEAREDERFSRNLRTQLVSNTGSSEGYGGIFDMAHEEPMERTTDEYITYVEYWDMRKRRHIIWCDGQSFSETQFLVDEDYPDGIEKSPYAMLLGFTPIIAPKPCPWPLPYVHSWLPVQEDWDSGRTQMRTGRKRTARKIYYDDSTFEDEDEAVKALQSSMDMQAVKLETTEKLPAYVPDPPLPMNIAQDLQYIDADWHMATGVSGAQGGGKGRNTAAEAKIEAMTGESRDLDMRHSVNIWLASSGENMLSLLKGTMTLGLYAKIKGTTDALFLSYLASQYGPELAQDISRFPNMRYAFEQAFGNDRWQRVTRSDLEFEHDVSVAPGSARPRNMETEKQEFYELVKLLGSVPMLKQSRMLLSKVADMFEFFDDSMIDEIMAAGARDMQLEQMKAGRFQGKGEPGPQPGQGAGMSQFRQQFVGQ